MNITLKRTKSKTIPEKVKMGNHIHHVYDECNYDTYHGEKLICITRDDKQYWIKSK